VSSGQPTVPPLLGAIFAVVVILLFLSGRNQEGEFKLSWRSTLVIAVSIPLYGTVWLNFAR
jgi:multidrug efflux pump subunit AcrB